MSRKSNRNAHAPVGAAPNPLEIDHASGHKKSKRNRPRLDHSSNTYTDTPIPQTSSPKRGGEHVSRSAPNDDDADGGLSNADAAETDEESDEDAEEDDAVAPSGRAIEKHGDQAGRISEDVPLNLVGQKSHEPCNVMGPNKTIEARPILHDSDDDVYNRVDLISDSEEDEPNVEQLEERNIIESEEADDLRTMPAYLEASDGWEGFELEDGLCLEDVPFFDQRYGRNDSNILDSEMELFQSMKIFDEFNSPQPPSPSPRRVRFKEPISQPSNDSDMDSDNGDINVLFSPVATLNVPSGGNLDLGGPYLDYKDDGSSVGSSSGYESGLHDLI